MGPELHTQGSHLLFLPSPALQTHTTHGKALLLTVCCSVPGMVPHETPTVSPSSCTAWKGLAECLCRGAQTGQIIDNEPGGENVSESSSYTYGGHGFVYEGERWGGGEWQARENKGGSPSLQPGPLSCEASPRGVLTLQHRAFHCQTHQAEWVPGTFKSYHV